MATMKRPDLGKMAVAMAASVIALAASVTLFNGPTEAERKCSPSLARVFRPPEAVLAGSEIVDCYTAGLTGPS
jgi:hypothetical protein